MINTKANSDQGVRYSEYVPEVDYEKPPSGPKLTTVKILGEEMHIITPKGFVRIEPEHEITKLITTLMADPMNDILATFIPEEQMPSFMIGDYEKLDTSRICFVKIYKKMKRVSPKPSLLTQTKKGMKKHGEQLLSKMKGIMGDYYNERSKTLNESFDLKTATELNDLFVLPMHEESDSHFGYSAFIKMSHDGKPEITTSTCSTIYTKNTMPQLVVHGNEDDLELTRQICSDWTKEFLKANRS